MTNDELNLAVAIHVARIVNPDLPQSGQFPPVWPNYVNDPAAVLELLAQEPEGWQADDLSPVSIQGARVRYAVCIGKSRGFGPTLHRAAVRALLRAHGVPGVNDRD